MKALIYDSCDIRSSSSWDPLLNINNPLAVKSVKNENASRKRKWKLMMNIIKYCPCRKASCPSHKLLPRGQKNYERWFHMNIYYKRSSTTSHMHPRVYPEAWKIKIRRTRSVKSTKSPRLYIVMRLRR